ncbi:hypothetical protein Pint_30294 [Pistacia integerrima]|uniref:Uncharacterized protein n=1 Tax=Pistacia integerrima TaxID=434235 RepID=A0ACC0X4I3_9ROSI|nr:hypothetical protein Pint_30294 [Pistacia integerrima]
MLVYLWGCNNTNLREEARKLEAQLDEQMNSYRKLVSTKVSTKVDTGENDLESGIDRLLKQLQQVNIQMQDWVSSGGSEMVSHTLTRHQEILQDLTQIARMGTNFLLDMIEVQEFYRLRSSLKAKQEHASLLEDFREFDRTRLDLEEGVGSAEQALLKEHASIGRNTGQVCTQIILLFLVACYFLVLQMDSVISQAQATLGTLVLQRSTFGGINSKLSNVSSRLPSCSFSICMNWNLNLIAFHDVWTLRKSYVKVNNILSAIRRKKSMDTIILSLVASVCTFLIFIYWLTK